MDLGGTKLLGGLVSSEGEVRDVRKVPVHQAEGPAGLLEQIADLANSLVKNTDIGDSLVTCACLASAGPLDPVTGHWLSPTNMTSDGQHWGVIPVVEELNRLTSLRWSLENDAAAAVSAEVWLGEGRGCHNVISVTLGTGVGVGVWANGTLLRAGRHLHTELGHMIIEASKKEVRCGCGNYGCAEAYLSGVNFTRWLQEKWNESGLTGKGLVERARSGEVKARDEFVAYGDRLALFLRNLAVCFAPEKIILSGGFSHAHELFLSQTQKTLEDLLGGWRTGVDLMPKLYISRFQEEMGLLGAARIAHSMSF